MADRPTPHLPVFRAGDAVLIEVEIRDVSKADEPRMDPLRVLISVTHATPQNGGPGPSVIRAPMNRTAPGVYDYTFQTEPTSRGVYRAEIVAVVGNLAQASQTYLTFACVQ
jgi:hypothetical protein